MIVFSVLGFFVVPPILKSILVKELSRAFEREVSIGEVKINPYLLSATVRHVLVKEKGRTAQEETFLSLEEFFVNLQSISALRMALVCKEIRITRPYLNLKRNSDLTFNFSDLFEKIEKAQVDKGKKKAFLFSFSNIKIKDGSIDFWDEPKKTKHTVRELNIGIPFLSNIPYYVETFVEPSFSVKVNDTFYLLKGLTKPFHDSKETNFEILIKSLNLPLYIAYVPAKINLKVVSGFLDASLKIRFFQSKTANSSLTLSGDLSIRDIAIDELDNKPLLRVPRINLSITTLKPLINEFHISRISIDSPELNILRRENQILNLAKVLPQNKNKDALKTTTKEETPTLIMDVDEVLISNGKIYFSDLSKSKAFKTVLFPIELKVNHFTTRKGEKATYSLSLNTESREDIRLSGEFSLAPLWSEGNAELKSIPIKKYTAYYQDFIQCNVEAGQLDLTTNYRYNKKEKEPEIGLSRLSLSLKELCLKKTNEEEEILRILSLVLKETDFNLTKKEIKVGKIQSEGGSIRIFRQKDGSIDLLQLFPQEGLFSRVSGDGKEKKEEKPWLISLRDVVIEEYQIYMKDQVPKDSVHLSLEKMKLKVENFSTTKNHEGKIAISFLLNKKGKVSATGTFGINPLQCNLKVDSKELPILPFQSYITEKLRIQITKGTISAIGNLSIAFPAKEEATVNFNGGLSLVQFTSIEKLTGEELLKWDSLNLENFQFDLKPLKVRIKGISLSDFYVRIILYPEGRLNLQEIIIREEITEKSLHVNTSPKKEQEEHKSRAISQNQIQIDTIVLQGGRIEFYDRSMDPPYFAKLVEIGGRVSGLSSEESAMADIELRGKLDEYAPLEIVGKINPLIKDLFVDIRVRFKDMDLTSITPYSSKYVGYTIEKGKLSFDLKYLIERRQLDSENHIFLDQFTFGEKVESPHATTLPVRLAIALLKDRNGVIRLDIPVRGTLDDPKFSLWRIILQIIVNLITKAATSPFALLGAIFGSGEELSYVEFEEGTLTLNEANVKKVENLAKTLQERPAVKLEIEGHVDLEKDRHGLKREIFLKKLKAQKLKEMISKGQQPLPSLDEVKIETTEYSKYLKMAYKEEKFPKPVNILGIIKDIPDAEMEKLMLTNIEVKESDLRLLALQRAQKIKEMILNYGEIDPGRIFLLEPKMLTPEKRQNIKDSRVDFKLK